MTPYDALDLANTTSSGRASYNVLASHTRSVAEKGIKEPRAARMATFARAMIINGGNSAHR